MSKHKRTLSTQQPARDPEPAAEKSLADLIGKEFTATVRYKQGDTVAAWEAGRAAVRMHAAEETRFRTFFDAVLQALAKGAR